MVLDHLHHDPTCRSCMLFSQTILKSQLIILRITAEIRIKGV